MPLVGTFDIEGRSPHSDIYQAPLHSLIVWTPRQTYDNWRLTFLFRTTVRGITCVRATLRYSAASNSSAFFFQLSSVMHQQAPGATTVKLEYSQDVYSISGFLVQDVMRCNFVGNVTMHYVIRTLQIRVPDYRLLPGNRGVHGWALLAVKALFDDGLLPAGTMDQFAASIGALRNASQTARNAIEWPIPFGATPGV
ncbi:unnamed protein product [Cyclocybe aegerita]|uniref:Uncharacterized protein n=1 Tax=Cyclocybe aegerita TaxID=1973307 RepID=A0A8S0WWT1_CYCAE|nr:unnamed protein product [Cyclocybe aegerita]